MRVRDVVLGAGLVVVYAWVRQRVWVAQYDAEARRLVGLMRATSGAAERSWETVSRRL